MSNIRAILALLALTLLALSSPLSLAQSATTTSTARTINPAISLSPTSGLPGTVVTITGTGFSANVTVTFSSSSITLSSASAKASPSGTFTAKVTVQGGSTGSIMATGNDTSTVPNDTASATFTVENVVASNVSTVTISPNGQFTVNDTTKDGVYVQGLGLLGITGLLTVSTASESGPPSGVSAQNSGSVYTDVRVQFPPAAGPPSGANANICIENPRVTTGWSLQYWSGGSWANASGTTVTGTTICGQVAMSALTGTPVAAVPPAGMDYTYYLVIVVVAVLVIIAIGVLYLRRRGPLPTTKQ